MLHPCMDDPCGRRSLWCFSMLRARYRAFERASTRARVVVVVVVGSSLASRVARDDRTHRRVASSCDARGVVGIHEVLGFSKCPSRARQMDPRVSARSCVIYTRLNTHTHVSDTNTSSVILTWAKTYTQCVHECDKTTRPGERRRPTAVRPRAPSRDARRDRRASTTRATPKI